MNKVSFWSLENALTEQIFNWKFPFEAYLWIFVCLGLFPSLGGRRIPLPAGGQENHLRQSGSSGWHHQLHTSQRPQRDPEFLVRKSQWTDAISKQDHSSHQQRGNATPVCSKINKSCVFVFVSCNEINHGPTLRIMWHHKGWQSMSMCMLAFSLHQFKGLFPDSTIIFLWH